MFEENIKEKLIDIQNVREKLAKLEDNNWTQKEEKNF